MNEKEQKAAEALLEKLLTASSNEAALLSQAYATLVQVGFNRIHATPVGSNK